MNLSLVLNNYLLKIISDRQNYKLFFKQTLLSITFFIHSRKYFYQAFPETFLNLLFSSTSHTKSLQQSFSHSITCRITNENIPQAATKIYCVGKICRTAKPRDVDEKTVKPTWL